MIKLRLLLIPLALLGLVSLALHPLLAGHIPWRGDGLLHLYRLAALDNAFSFSNLYPRWLSELGHGYGFPLFNYYAPLSYYLVLPLLWLGLSVPTAHVLSFAGAIYLLAVSAYGWGKDLWGTWAGITTAVALTYAPYTLYNLHHRAALGELWGLAWLVFLFWMLHRLLTRQEKRYVWLTAVGYAALILSHNITALLGTLFLLAYVLVQGAGGNEQGTMSNEQSAPHSPFTIHHLPFIILPSLFAILLSLALSAFFWLPALGERSYVQIERLTNTADYAISANFLTLNELSRLPVPAEPLRANPDPPLTLQPLLPLFLLTLILAGWRGRRRLFDPRLLFFSVAALFTLFMTLPASQFIWDLFPLLRFVQFPWRMLGLTNLFLALSVGWASSLLVARLGYGAGWLGLAPFLVVGLFWLYPSAPPALPDPLDVRQFEQETGWLGLTAAGDYLPTAVSQFPTAPTQFTPRTSLALAEEAPLLLDQFYFPGWRVHVNGQPVDIIPSEPHGLIQTAATFPPDTYQVEATFGPTPLRAAATSVSLLALLALGVHMFRHRPLSLPPSLNLSPENMAPLLITAVFLLTLTGIKQFYGDRQPHPFVAQAAPLGQEVANFDQQLRLLAYQLPAPNTAVDTPLPITLYWQAIQPTAELSVGIHLLGQNGLRYGQSDQMHPGGYPVTRWLPHEYAVDAHALTPLPGTPPGRYDLELVVYERATGANVPLVNEAGQPLGLRYALGEVVLAEPTQFAAPEALLAEAAYPVNLALQPDVTLLGFDLATTRLEVGTQFPLTLYWHTAVSPTSLTDPFTLYLTRPDGQHVWRVPASPAAPSSAWQVGQTSRDAYLLTIPAQADGEALASGKYTLSINDKPLTTVDIVAPERSFVAPTTAVVLNQPVGDLATLTGYDFQQNGDQVEITLGWQVNQLTSTSYIAFVQLFDPNGQLIAQSDQPPGAYSRPTTSWLPGEFITDPHTLMLPPTSLPHTLLIGLYDPLTGERLGEVREVLSDER